MNTATHSTREGAETSMSSDLLDVLDELDLAGKLIEAIQVVAASEVQGRVIDALARLVEQQHGKVRAILGDVRARERDRRP